MVESTRGQARIWTAFRANFMTPLTRAEVYELLRVDEEFVTLPTITGQTAFPPEYLTIRPEQVVGVQEVSAESWIWQQEADTQHYARVLSATSADRIADAQEKLAEFLEREMGEG